jgi:hypothetical protein
VILHGLRLRRFVLFIRKKFKRGRAGLIVFLVKLATLDTYDEM